MANSFPRLNCRYAATKRPNKLTTIKPKTIPDKSGSTIIYFFK